MHLQPARRLKSSHLIAERRNIPPFFGTFWKDYIAKIERLLRLCLPTHMLIPKHLCKIQSFLFIWVKYLTQLFVKCGISAYSLRLSHNTRNKGFAGVPPDNAKSATSTLFLWPLTPVKIVTKRETNWSCYVNYHRRSQNLSCTGEPEREEWLLHDQKREHPLTTRVVTADGYPPIRRPLLYPLKVNGFIILNRMYLVYKNYFNKNPTIVSYDQERSLKLRWVRTQWVSKRNALILTSRI